MFPLVVMKPLWFLVHKIYVFFGENQAKVGKEKLTFSYIHGEFEALKTENTSSWTECLETWIVKEKDKDQSDHLKSLVEFSEESNFDNEIKNLKHKGFQFPMKVNIYRHETITLEAKVKLMLLTIFLMWLVTENLSTESLIVSSLRLMLRINVL